MLLTILSLLAIFSSIIHTTSAQSTSGCISNIILCGNYVATTAIPPQSCCVPLKIAITTQIDCLCGLYNTPGLLQSFNINVTQALDVPKRCGMVTESKTILAACSKGLELDIHMISFRINYGKLEVLFINVFFFLFSSVIF